MSSSPHWNAQGTGGWNRPGPDTGRPPPGASTPWGNAPWGNPPWGITSWETAPWNPARFGRTPLIVAKVLGFILGWPVGLLILGYLWWSGQMGCWGRRAPADGRANGMSNNGWDRPGFSPWAMWRGRTGAPTSGNRAFDEYRSETLRRLEEEQQEFAAYLDRLRVAKDKAEFDQFMAERWQRPAAPQADQPQQS